MGIEKLPQLEELHLMMNPFLISDEFETIGIPCPMLKSFSYHNCLSKDGYSPQGLDFSEHAEAIGKTMPNLRHLRLCEHGMGYKGLEAILDGCPHLKSLDLRLCYALEKAYYGGIHSGSEQRKDLWLHTGSISFMDWIMQRKDSYDSDFEYIDDSYDSDFEYIDGYVSCDDRIGDFFNYMF